MLPDLVVPNPSFLPSIWNLWLLLLVELGGPSVQAGKNNENRGVWASLSSELVYS